MNMKNADRDYFEIKKANMCVTIQTGKNKFTYINEFRNVSLISDTKLKMEMLDDLETSGLVNVERYIFDGGSQLRLNKTELFDTKQFMDLMLDIIEKYEL